MVLSRRIASLVAFSAAVAAPLFACSAPTDDAVASDNQALTECDAAGTWAIKVETPVSWPATFVLQAGSGTVTNWIKSTRTQDGTTVTDSAQLCGVSIPDYQATAMFGAEKYGVRFPDAMFDLLPTFSLAGSLSSREVGATFSSPGSAALVGATMANPTTDPWPSSGAALGPQDPDNDGKPGVTANAASDAGQSNPPVNPGRTARADKIYTAFRQVIGQTSGTVESCSRVVGKGQVAVINNKPAIDSHVLGCRRVDGAECSSSEFKLLDSAAPVYKPTGDSVVTMVKLAPNADTSCAAVRALDFAAQQ